MYGCLLKDNIPPNAFDIQAEHPFLQDQFSPKLTKLIFNMTTGGSEMEILINDFACEYPVIS